MNTGIHILLYFVIVTVSEASHFRGGTISWQPTGIGYGVQFSFKLGWIYGQGPGCTPALIGSLVTGMNSTFWRCTSGCTSTSQPLSTVNYICTGASVAENWEQGERNFEFTFPGEGPFVVEFTGCCWISLNYGSPSSWSIQTVVNLATRSDIQQPNSSPVTTGKPMYTFQYGCRLALQIPVADVNGDILRCRWSTGSECVSVCTALPYASLDSETCTITFPSNHTVNGIYAVAITVEDFPRSNILIGGRTYTPSDPMTSVHLQLHISFYIASNQTISRVDVTSPAWMTYTSPLLYPGRPGVVFINTTWTPTALQIGSHILCVLAEDNNGKASDSRCVEIRVTDISPCVSEPCLNNGTCIRLGMTQNFTCSCIPGYTDRICQTEIDECASQPCLNNGTCTDFLNSFSCTCHPGFTGANCETDINECASFPCLNGGSCRDQINLYQCACAAGYGGYNCEIDIDECAINPCTFLFDCFDGLNDRVCKLNEFKLAALVTALALTVGITIFIICKNKKKYRKVDHSWLSNYLDVRKPDSQPKLVYQPRSVQNLNQTNTICTLFSLGSKNFLK